MIIKEFLQRAIGELKCIINHIKFGKNVYVGLNVKVVNIGEVALGNNVKIRPSSGIYTRLSSSRIIFEDNVEIGNHSTIASKGLVHMGKYVLTGPHVFIADNDHQYRDINTPVCQQGESWVDGEELHIGDGTWIGTNAVIVGNLSIGKNCVIGANSVVTKDIPDYSVAVGSPAKVVKKYNLETKCWERV